MAKAKSKTKAKVKTKPKVKAKTKAKVKVAAKSKAKAKPKATPKARAKVEAAPKAQATPKAHVEVVAPEQRVPVEQPQPAPKPQRQSKTTLYAACKEKLLKSKEDHLNEFRSYDASLSAQITGDDGDVSSAIEGQGLAVARREKVLNDLKEIEAALNRIEQGTYGICEETGEEIEERRLLTIPWTRLSLEGAITRERELKDRRRA